MTNKETREAAAQLLEQYGWIRGMSGSRSLGFCVGGAVYEANQDRFPSVLNELTAELDEAVVYWNDHTATSITEVLSLLRGTRVDAGFSSPALEPEVIPEPQPLVWPTTPEKQEEEKPEEVPVGA